MKCLGLPLPWQSGPELSETPPSPLYYPGYHGNQNSSRLPEAKPHGKWAGLHTSSRTPVSIGTKASESQTHLETVWTKTRFLPEHFTGLPINICLKKMFQGCICIKSDLESRESAFCCLSAPMCAAYSLQLWRGCGCGLYTSHRAALNKWQHGERIHTGQCPDQWSPGPPPRQ